MIQSSLCKFQLDRPLLCNDEFYPSCYNSSLLVPCIHRNPIILDQQPSISRTSGYLKATSKKFIFGCFCKFENLDTFRSNVISNESTQINTSLQQKDLIENMELISEMKILAARESYSFQADYNKLVQNGHLLLLGIEGTLFLFYVRPGKMLVPS